MMTRRAHQAKGLLAGLGSLQRGQRRTGAIPGAVGDVRKVRCIRVEIMRFIQPCQVFFGVGPQKRRLRRWTGFCPGNRQFGLSAEFFECPADSRWPFGAACFRRPPEPNPRSRSALGQWRSANWQREGGTVRQRYDNEGGKKHEIAVYLTSCCSHMRAFKHRSCQHRPCRRLIKNPVP
jgi:hypothetical protein